MNRVVTLRPGAKGTKRVVDQFGEQLLYVRYRYNWAEKKCTKTAEIILSERLWDPQIQEDTKVYVWIAMEEVGFRLDIKDAGGKWVKERKLWQVSYKEVERLGLTSRIVK